MCSALPHHENSIQRKLLLLFFSVKFDFLLQRQLGCDTVKQQHAQPSTLVCTLNMLASTFLWQAAGSRSNKLVGFCFAITISLTPNKYDTENAIQKAIFLCLCACFCFCIVCMFISFTLAFGVLVVCSISIAPFYLLWHCKVICCIFVEWHWYGTSAAYCYCFAFNLFYFIDKLIM